MNKSNIISAGAMMSIVITILGILFAIIPEIFSAWRLLIYNVPIGVSIAVSGIVMAVLFTRVERQPEAFGILILMVSIAVAAIGVATIALVRNPFSWMIAIVAMAIFIDAACLKIALRNEPKSAKR